MPLCNYYKYYCFVETQAKEGKFEPLPPEEGREGGGGRSLPDTPVTKGKSTIVTVAITVTITLYVWSHI